MIRYDKLWETMADRGITKYRLWKDYNISKSLLNRLKFNESINMNTLNTLCSILNCRVEDIITYYPDEDIK